MKQKQLAKIVREWGSCMDPEVSAETYLNSRDAEAAAWARENAQELDALDSETANLYRRQREHTDYRTAEELELAKKNAMGVPRGGRPHSPENRWLNEIFGDDPEEFYQMVGSEKLAEAIRKLTPHQRRVIHMSAVQELRASEIAEAIGTSERNVRDVLQRAYAMLRRGADGEGYPETASVILGWMLFPTFMLGWQISKRVYPAVRRTLLKNAA
jgi:RNA polymerase sigma factor (sigma-70 family)